MGNVLLRAKQIGTLMFFCQRARQQAIALFSLNDCECIVEINVLNVTQV